MDAAVQTSRRSQESSWLERRTHLQSELFDLINAHYDGHSECSKWMTATSKQMEDVLGSDDVPN
jgi:hypothetical protein